MTDPVGSLLAGRVPAGVYRWSGPAPEDAEARADERGWRSFFLDGEGVRGRAAFLATCSDAFGLPEWFGHNWDALWDSLTDLTEAPGYLVLYDRWTDLATGSPAAWAAARRVLNDVSRYWQRRDTPFAVLLTGGGSDDVPEFPRS